MTYHLAIDIGASGIFWDTGKTAALYARRSTASAAA